MSYSAILIQGNIISSEVLEKIRTEDIRFQTAKDFKLPPNTSVRDEINMAWSLALSHWEAFKKKREKLTTGNTGVTETRRYWMLPFLGLLGYELSASSAEIINGKTYAISHRATNLDGFPVHIVGILQSLDKRVESSGPRLSPHALTQEYLNNQEHLYGLITNGMFLRLLRDSTRLSRFSYLEFNLEQIMEEQLYAEFALLFRSIHATRMPQDTDTGKECVLEYYHEEAIAHGSRIRDKLSGAVETSIKEIATSFIQNPANDALRHSIANGTVSAREYYVYNLRLIYRLLFLMVIEERKLVFPEIRDRSLDSKRKIYYAHYSIQRITSLARKKVFVDPDKNDLWLSIQSCFSLFEESRYGQILGISPLGFGLFSPTALGILSGQTLTNQHVLNVIRHLTSFINEQGQWVRVNYADLDVEEFGSVYEGLLEYEPDISNGTFIFKEGSGRRDSGSHYTPEELVKPLIQHSLDYQIQERLNSSDPETNLLSLKVCDVACGSGHILLSAARRIGLELARLRSGEDHPAPSIVRHAVGDTIRNCIYGVDKNPLAVELCKVAMWLEAHEPGQPLNFLDHHIKCGDAIVGLSHRDELGKGIPNEAFNSLPEDDKKVAKLFRDKNNNERKKNSQGGGQQLRMDESLDKTVQDAMREYHAFNLLSETTPEEIEQKERAYRKFVDGKGFAFLKTIADVQIAQFFIPKTERNKDFLVTDEDFRLMLRGYNRWEDKKVEKSSAIAFENRFFHWFIEFPEVFEEGGFDCVLGNPPFLGGKRISGAYGNRFLENIKYQFSPIGAVDLVAYFFRRIYSLITEKGFLSLISTNSIAQGKTREDGLDIIVQQGGTINHAIKSMRWPGEAVVEISLVTITKQEWKAPFVLSGKQVTKITPYLDNADLLDNPFRLKYNDDKSFVGSFVLGKGFLLEPEIAREMIRTNPSNRDVLFPYLNGDDLNNSPDQSPSRWVINFFDWPEATARQYPDCYKIIEALVKPERQRWEVDKNGNEIVGRYKLRKPLPQKWWIYADKRPALYEKMKSLDRVLVVAQVSKTLAFTFVPSNQVISMMCIVLAFDKAKYLSILQSSIHKEWVCKYASALKSDTRYTPSDVFETFPFPENISSAIDEELEMIGERYYNARQRLMYSTNLGLTKIYNFFHNSAISPEKVNDKNKHLEALRIHLEKTGAAMLFEEFVREILQLRQLHAQMDQIVANAYGWGDIDFRLDFYEVEYLPENDRIRFAMHPEARKEILRRLLVLNHKQYDNEQALIKLKQGQDTRPKKGTKKRRQRFTQLQFPMRPETAYAAIYSAQDIARITKVSTTTIKRWLQRLYTEGYEGISKDSSTVGQPLLINFYGVHELIVLYDLRVVNKIPLQDILDARKWLIERFATGPNFYPFTSQKVLDTISKAGKQIIFTDEKKGDYITLGKGNAQLNLAFIKDFLKRLIFDKEMVSRLYLSDSETIAIDPSLAGGRPCTVHNEILIDSIKSVYMESKDIKYIASVYEISEESVQDALNFEQASVLN